MMGGRAKTQLTPSPHNPWQAVLRGEYENHRYNQTPLVWIYTHLARLLLTKRFSFFSIVRSMLPGFHIFVACTWNTPWIVSTHPEMLTKCLLCAKYCPRSRRTVVSHTAMIPACREIYCVTRCQWNDNVLVKTSAPWFLLLCFLLWVIPSQPGL